MNDDLGRDLQGIATAIALLIVIIILCVHRFCGSAEREEAT